jgi:hypothetical protein
MRHSFFRLAFVRAALAVIAVLLLATSCAEDRGGRSTDSAATPGIAPEAEYRSQGPADGQGAPEAAPDREVISTAWIDLRVDDPRERAAEIVAIVNDVGGRVDHRSEQPGTDEADATAQLTVRVPADQLQSVLDRFEELGTVANLTLDATDVTAQAVDLDARIQSLQRSVDRLLEIISNTTRAEDLISAENALAERQAQLESYQSQREYLSDQVALSTVTVNLSAEPVEPTPAAGFWGGLQRGWDSLLAALKSFAVALGVALPWLGFVVLLAGLLYLAIRGLARRGHQPPAPGTEHEPPAPVAGTRIDDKP